MTKHLRVEPIVRRPEDAHRRYNGGRLAELVFLVELMVIAKARGRARGSRKREINALFALAFLAVCHVVGVAVTRPGSFTSDAVASEPVADEIDAAYVAGNDWITQTRHPPRFDIVPRYLP
jgi:hypothetical protein